MLSMCIMLIIYDVSIENQKVYGILCIELFPRQSSHRIRLDIFISLFCTCILYLIFMRHVFKLRNENCDD